MVTTYTHPPLEDDVVVTVRMPRQTYRQLEKLAAICAKRQGTPVDEEDIPDLIVQAVDHSLAQLSEEYGL